MSELSRLALIALGCNQDSVWGDATLTVQKASRHVAKFSKSVVCRSGFFRTSAFPVGSGPDYINAAMVISTNLQPRALLEQLHKIETMADRKRDVRWGPRTLDLDLIAMDDLVLPDAETHGHWRNLPFDQQQQTAPTELILPHPRMQDRAFVLVPLREVAPDWVHPVFGTSIARMCADLSPDARADVVPVADAPPLEP